MNDYSFHDAFEAYVMVGNGFDKECGLPTGYQDYLNFISAVRDKLCHFPIKNTGLCSEIYSALENSSESKLEQFSSVIDSWWIDHFQNVIIRNRWIDFENEISRVIRIIENHIEETSSPAFSMDDCIRAEEQSEFVAVFNRYLNLESMSTRLNRIAIGWAEYEVTYRRLLECLLKDLNSLIRGFEIYLRDYVSTIPINKTESIKRLINSIKQANDLYVLSFNYTTTMERLLIEEGIEAEYCYVHGKIGNGKNKNQMVLGIDEHLMGADSEKYLGVVPFRKYYQRIYKETDSNYMDWIEELQGTQQGMAKLFIFGHSLGITDRDIIGPFVLADGMETVSYYYRDDAFADQVANLTTIIGKEAMIRLCGGKYRQLRFVSQENIENRKGTV